MVFVVAFSFWYSLKYEKRKPGMAYPVTTMVYVITRFFWEFMRYYKYEEMRHLVLGMTFWQFCCLMTIAVSCIWLMLLKNEKFNKAEVKFYAFTEGRYKAFTDKVENFKHRNDKNIVHHKKRK